jgi:hypothetical protein
MLRWWPRHARSTRRERRCRPAVAGLEDRQVPAIADIKAVAVPNLLTPPGNQFVKVTVTGSVTDTGAELPLVHYQTVDEYRIYEPGAALALTPTASANTYNFSFSVVLQARRANIDPSGRLYVLTVAAQDKDGSRGVVLPVLAPHGLTAPPKPVHKLPPPKPTPANPHTGNNQIPLVNSGSFFKNLFGQAGNIFGKKK